ncbi:hypothetical protein CJ030_MR7G027339 [Morella rubra]|uniref:Uncharacterized protein n=1 Tax=Morella rubra TaxID=262757 RepID=A0A6A1V8P5_9ROSI|nr:hypothetical protein CJ030_MR7G027339 [Morella rubra]
MTYTPENAWFADSFRAGSENFPLTNIMEGFADIPVYNCNDQNSLMTAADNLDNGDKSCSGNFDETNKNYWNSILNLVNASSSGSPVF